MMQGVLLENYIERHDWPINLTIGGAILRLVEDPVFAPLTKGDSTFGWEGDSRLAVYVSSRGAFELVRFEANGTYSSLSRFAYPTPRAVEMVAKWVLWLVTHDGRRGHDLVGVFEKEQAKADKAADDALTDKIAHEIQPRMAHALQRDGVFVGGGLHQVTEQPWKAKVFTPDQPFVEETQASA